MKIKYYYGAKRNDEDSLDGDCYRLNETVIPDCWFGNSHNMFICDEAGTLLGMGTTQGTLQIETEPFEDSICVIPKISAGTNEFIIGETVISGCYVVIPTLYKMLGNPEKVYVKATIE